MKQTLWSFKIGSIEVVLEAYPEEMHPADSFEFQEDFDAVLNGDVAWFAAVVNVYKIGHIIGSDSLGGCAYKTVEEFYTSHRDPNPMNRNCSIMRKARGEKVSICHYFPDMVRQAIADARQTLSI